MSSPAPTVRRLTALSGEKVADSYPNADLFFPEQEKTRIIELLETALINGVFSTLSLRPS